MLQTVRWWRASRTCRINELIMEPLSDTRMLTLVSHSWPELEF